MLSGKKTYLVAAAMLVYQVLGYLLGYSQGVDLQAILGALGLAALRKGMK